MTDTLSGTVHLDSGVVLTMTGDIDMFTAAYFRTLVDEAISIGVGTVTVNLAGVTFIYRRGALQPACGDQPWLRPPGLGAQRDSL